MYRQFALWAEEGLPMFRYSLLLGPDLNLGADRLESLIDVAISECERFYPAFQYVIWGGKAPAEAVEAAMRDTVAEAGSPSFPQTIRKSPREGAFVRTGRLLSLSP
jgi:hypothetical protein